MSETFSAGDIWFFYLLHLCTVRSNYSEIPITGWKPQNDIFFWSYRYSSCMVYHRPLRRDLLPRFAHVGGDTASIVTVFLSVRRQLSRGAAIYINVRWHYGPERSNIPALIIYCLTSSGVGERCKQMSEWTIEWPSTYVLILGCPGPQWMDMPPFSLSLTI